MKRAPLLLMMLCITAWTVMAVAAVPSTSLASTPSTTSPTTASAPSPTIFQYMIWMVSPTVRAVVGNMTMQPSDFLGWGNWRGAVEFVQSNESDIHRGAIKTPEAPIDRPKPHTQSSERAVPSIPDG